MWISRDHIEREPTGQYDLIIYIFDPSKTVDLIDLWNVRQLNRHVLLSHVDWFKEGAEFIRSNFERHYRPLPQKPYGVMIHTTVECARWIPKTIAEQLVRDHLAELPQGSWSLKLRYDPIWKVD